MRSLNIDNLDGYDFEDLCARIFRKVGYTNVKVTQRSNDMGKDILMTSSEGYPVVVECKHQHFVGRPIIQKLQGAMVHEKGSSDFIKGIVVTSGKFPPNVLAYVDYINSEHKDQKLELIDGKKLKKLCEQNNIIILNGKIQIITDNTIPYISREQMKEEILKEYNQIIGSKKEFINSIIKYDFYPSYYLQFDVHAEFHTSVGKIHSINKKDVAIILDGCHEGQIDEVYEEHFFTVMPPDVIQENQNSSKVFEFTEKDIEEDAIKLLRDKLARDVTYYGRNNVSYTKKCKPKKSDIDIIYAIPVYLPILKNNIHILKHNYNQEVLSNKENLKYIHNHLERCYISKSKSGMSNKLYLCNKCGQILCWFHKRLDFLDETPVCKKDAITRRLFIRVVSFINRGNLKKFDKLWEEKNIFQKIWADKILSGLIVFFILLLILILI